METMIARQEALARGRRGDVPLDEAVDLFGQKLINAREYDEIWTARWKALSKSRTRKP
jgi:hypothetical protein